MNCDNSICEYDLFSIIRHTDNELFIQSVNQDIKDIRARMLAKAQDQIFLQNKKAFNEEECKIRDLPRWLHDREAKKTIQETFLKVFTSPKSYPYPGQKPFDDKAEGSNFSLALQEQRSIDKTERDSPLGKLKNKDYLMKAMQKVPQQIIDMQSKEA
jgi:hypothetical protein